MRAALEARKAHPTNAVSYEDYSVSLGVIGRDGYFAIRDDLDRNHVRALANRIRGVGALDRVLLWQGPRGIVTLDGAHRVEAYRAAKWTDSVPAQIVHCDRHTALLLAMEANSKVALVMDNATRSNLAWRLVREPQKGPKPVFTKAQIMRATGVSKGTVDNMRTCLAALSAANHEPSGNWRRDYMATKGGDWNGIAEEEREPMIQELAKEVQKVLNVRGIRDDQIIAEALFRALGEVRLRGCFDYLYPEDDGDEDDSDEDPSGAF